MIKAEILAPAGNIEALKAAVQYGADAVYFGLSEFNARMKADNFTLDNLAQWVDFCHLYGVKVYLTINTIIKNGELGRLAEIVYKAATCNVDAFIVADIATIETCKKICPSIPLHFSTQFGVHNLEGARNAVELGAKRIILARETPLNEIKRIKDGVDVEIEAFVHGAMCVSFSGSCYLSSFLDGCSGNRGRCKQPCRLKYYSSISQNEGYYLSMKDLNLIGRLSELVQSGVVSLKIEGRLKSAEYVAAAVVAYKKALLGEVTKDDLDNLKSGYSRRSTKNGYLDGKKSDLIATDIQNNIGLEIGKVVNTSKLKNGLNKVYFTSNRKLVKGDGLKVIYRGVEICGAELTSDKTEDGFYVLYVSKNPPVGASVSVTQSSNLLSCFKKKDIKVKFAIIEVDKGEFELILSDDKNVVKTRIIVDKDNCAKTEQYAGIECVLKKSSEPFSVGEVKIKLFSDAFIPYSILNKARKECIKKLEKVRIESYNKQVDNYVCYEEIKSDQSVVDACNKLACVIDEDSVVTEELLRFADLVIISISNFQKEDVGRLLDLLPNKAIYLELPLVSFEEDIKVLYKTIEKYNTRIDGIYSNGQYGIDIAKKYKLKFFAGPGINVLNNVSRKLYKKCVLSKELSEKEILEFSTDSYVYAYGCNELMYFTHCPNYAARKNCEDCAFDKGDVSYSDKNACYRIKRMKIKNCYFAMYSSKPMSLFKFVKLNGFNAIIDLRGCEDFNTIFKLYQSGFDLPSAETSRMFRGIK